MSTKNDKELDYYTIHSATVSTQVSPAATSSIVARDTKGMLMGLNVVAGASAGFVMVLDTNVAPADGAVVPLKCFPIAANGSLFVQFDPPIGVSTGATIVFSTTGPFAKTASATAYISAETQAITP